MSLTCSEPPKIFLKKRFLEVQTQIFGVQMVKYLPAMWDTWILSLVQEDPLEKGIAIHYTTLAWRIPWTEEPDGLQSMGSQRVRHD